MPTYRTWSTTFRGVVEECLVTLPNGSGTEWPALVFSDLQDFLALTKEMAASDDSLIKQLRECQNQVGRTMLERQIAGAPLDIELCMLTGDSYPFASRFLWKIPPERFVRRGPLMEIYLNEYTRIQNPNPEQSKLLQALLANLLLNVNAAVVEPAQDAATPQKEDAKMAPAQMEQSVPQTSAAVTMPIENSKALPTDEQQNDVIMEDTTAVNDPSTTVAARNDPTTEQEPRMDTPRQKAPPRHKESSPSATTPKIRTKTSKQASTKRSMEEFLRRPCLNIARESEIAAILEKGGYKHTKGAWTRPNENKEVFSMKELRHHLCKYGINCQCHCSREETVACKCWSEDDKRDLFRWVRSSIFSQSLSHYCLIDSTYACGLLKSLGFQRNREGYRLPGTDHGDEAFPDGDLFKELAKEGLPPTCNFDAINAEELFSLECFLAYKYRFTFNYRPERRRLSYTPITTKLARKKRMPTSPSTVVTNDDVGTNTKKRPSGSNRKGTKKRKNSPDPSIPEVEVSPGHSSPEVEYHVTEAETSTPVITSEPTKPQMKPFELIQENDYSEPEFHGSDAEKLRSASAALSLSNRFDSPSFQSDQPSRFTESINAVYKFLQDSVNNRTREISEDNGGSNALYVCGVPGIGKTSGVHWCCDQFIEANKDAVEFQLEVCKINASSLITGNSSPLVDVVREVKRVLGMPSNTNLEGICRRLNRVRAKHGGLAKYFLVLVVDEIDALMTSKKLREVFRVLMELTDEPLCQFAMIGISNSMSDEKYAQMQSVATFGQSVTFSAYSEQELVYILKARVGSLLVDQAALNFVAKKVSLSSGDARSALDMLATAMQRRLDTASEEYSTDGPLIKMQHVHLVSRGEKETSVKAIIEGQSTSMKSLLCILLSLSQGGVVETTLGNLRHLVNECLRGSGKGSDMLHLDDFCLSIEMLADHGLIRLSHKSPSMITEGFLLGLSMVERAKQSVCLGTQLDEVQKVLEADLKQSFYQTIRDDALRKGRKESGKTTN